MTSVGAWRRPRMKVYDYNQEFGGNYYQPMIQYIQHKEVYGPFAKKADVYLPHTAEVCSNKYTNMRYQDKSSAKHNLDEFLVNAHAKQIKELNGTTASVHYNQLHGAAPPTPYTDSELLGSHLSTERTRRHYIRELGLMANRDHAREREELGEVLAGSFVDGIRQRNRMDRIRRAARDQLAAESVYLADNWLDPEYGEIDYSDPLSYGTIY